MANNLSNLFPPRRRSSAFLGLALHSHRAGPAMPSPRLSTCSCFSCSQHHGTWWPFYCCFAASKALPLLCPFPAAELESSAWSLHREGWSSRAGVLPHVPFSAHSDKAWGCHALFTLALVFLVQTGLLGQCSLTSPGTKRNWVTILTELSRSSTVLRSYYRAFMLIIIFQLQISGEKVF